MQKINIFGINNNEIKVLKNKEMIELFEKFKNGDNEAREKLIKGNIKLVLSIINYYNNDKYDLNDLFQVGMIGLIKAVDNFDINVGVMFSTYAHPLILGEIKRYVRDSSTVKITRSIKDLMYHIMKYEEDYFNNNGILPETNMILEKFDITEYEYFEAINSLNKPLSIYEPIYNDGGDTIYLLDQISDKELNKDELISLKNALLNLKERDKDIIIKRYFIGLSQVELANILNVSQAQISRLENNALKEIKKLMN